MIEDQLPLKSPIELKDCSIFFYVLLNRLIMCLNLMKEITLFILSSKEAVSFS